RAGRRDGDVVREVVGLDEIGADPESRVFNLDLKLLIDGRRDLFREHRWIGLRADRQRAVRGDVRGIAGAAVECPLSLVIDRLVDVISLVRVVPGGGGVRGVVPGARDRRRVFPGINQVVGGVEGGHGAGDGAGGSPRGRHRVERPAVDRDRPAQLVGVDGGLEGVGVIDGDCAPRDCGGADSLEYNGEPGEVLNLAGPGTAVQIDRRSRHARHDLPSEDDLGIGGACGQRADGDFSRQATVGR
ncbi:MAG: hypothetical protein ACK56F_32805, partial [bacterium]